MKRIIHFVLFVVCVQEASAQRLAQITDSMRRAFEIPALAIAVVKPDTIPVLFVTGYHRADRKIVEDSVSVYDYFHLGSNSKAITGFIAAWLVEKGKLRWDTKFFKSYPSMLKGSQSAYLNMTLSDLLAHRARIPAFTNGSEFDSLPTFKGNVAERRRQFAKYLVQQTPVPDDNLPFHYSNAGYTLAALMLEKASSKTWEQLVQEVLGKKLKLRYRMGWPNRKDTCQPWGHWMEGPELKPLGPDIAYNLNLIEPAGDVSMPLPDYARFIQLNLQGQEGESNFLKARTYEFLHFGLEKYSIGWANREDNGKIQTEHAGSAGTFFCYTLVDKTASTAYIIIANVGAECAEDAVRGMLKVLKAEYF